MSRFAITSYEDDVGRWIPEGLAEGIDAKASVVYGALNKMTGKMLKIATPELALGTAGIRMNASAAMPAPVGSSSSRIINNDNGSTIIIEKIENYSDSDIPEFRGIAWIIDREREIGR